jgi:hypothetical protein
MCDSGLHSASAIRFSIGLAILASAFSGCSDDPESVEQIVIYAVSPTKASAGDTLDIDGKGFSSDPLRNTVYFSSTGYSDPSTSRPALPVSISGSRLRIIVPEGSYTGGVRVETPVPFGGGPFEMESYRVPSNELGLLVRLLDGDVAKLFFSSSVFSMPVSTERLGEEYILILFDSSVPPDKDMTVLFSVDGDDFCAASGNASGRGFAGSPGRAAEIADERPGGAMSLFDRKKREDLLDLLKGVRASKGGESGKVGSTVSGLQPDRREFFVFSNFEGSTIDPDDFTLVTADLKYEGDHTLLYLDSSTHFSCITDQEAENLGEKFENDIYPINTSSFGSESDINRDGKVVILLTPVVNELTPPGPSQDGIIAGFFLPGDLLPTYVPTGASNGMEIYYSMVPDPNGIYGNAYSKDYALGVMEGVLAHEFQHMIMFNYRILKFGNGFSAAYMAELWVDEGLSHIAEDLNGHDSDNIKRSNIFLADPGKTTLIHGGDDLDERGASFLFFRYLGDRFGEDIYRDIVQTKRTGTDNIEYVTGLPFKEVFSEWAATLYFESTGRTPADPKYSYTSIDLSGDFDPLRVVNGELCLAPVMGYVKSMGPEFIHIGFTGIDEGDLTVSSDALGRMNAVLIRIQ